MSEPHVQWTAPSPLWESIANATEPAVRQTLGQPAILRFASDTFMDELLALLDNDPAQVRDLVAQPETWRRPTPLTPASLQAPALPLSRLARRLQRARRIAARTSGGGTALFPSSGAQADGDALPLKLYQPAHQRYYLVASCLVCRQIGLPDRRLDTANQERATFVVRRLVHPDPSNTTAVGDPASWVEYALVQTPRGNVWQPIPLATPRQADVLVPGEEQLPLFAMHFSADDGHKRRLFAGLIPVGRREAYVSAAQGTPPAPGGTGVPATVAPTDPRMVLLYAQVREPWKRLLERAAAVRQIHEGEDEAPPAPVRLALLRTAREQIQTVSWYIVLDLADYLARYLPALWQVVIGAQPPSTLAGTAADPLFTALQNTSASDSLRNLVTAGTALNPQNNVWAALRQALQGIEAYRAALEGVTRPYDRTQTPAPTATSPVWPTHLFPLAEPMAEPPLPPLTPAPTGTDLEKAQKRVDHLAELVRLALPLETTAPMPAPSLLAQPLLDVREPWFILRCVFERPNCGPLEPPVVSAPTPPFQLAGFFDPDAPARPIRIALPIDTSPAGLRKFDKNTVFMMSDILCGQIDRVKALNLGDLVRSVLPWPFHKELSVPDTGPCTDPNDPSLSLGTICSLSIPIITICALLLLMIIVNLLDIIFRWLPYFLICFPVPGLKGKKS